VHLDPWPDPGTTYTDPDIYLEASALLNRAKNYLTSTDIEQAVTPKII